MHSFYDPEANVKTREWCRLCRRSHVSAPRSAPGTQSAPRAQKVDPLQLFESTNSTFNSLLINLCLTRKQVTAKRWTVCLLCIIQICFCLLHYVFTLEHESPLTAVKSFRQTNSISHTDHRAARFFCRRGLMGTKCQCLQIGFAALICRQVKTSGCCHMNASFPETRQ